MERHKINMKNNHKISEEEDKIIKMKKLRNGNKKNLYKGLNWKLMTLTYIWS